MVTKDLFQKPLHQLLFYLLLILLPTQLGKHFWLSFSLIVGLRIDYLAPTLYFTDLLIAALFILWFRDKKLRKHWYRFLLPILSLFLLNVLSAKSPFVTLYQWGRFLELAFVGYYIARVLEHNDGLLARFVSISIIYSSLLALGQFIRQQSMGGWLYFLGERAFSSQTPGIATAILDGRVWLRPYATLPHPNVLAGYLTVLLPILLLARCPKKAPVPKMILIALGWGLATLFLTFSRTAWMVSGLLIVIIMLVKRKKGELSKGYIATVATVLLVGTVLFGSFMSARVAALQTFDRESLFLRSQLNTLAFRMFADRPLLGVGLGGFIPSIPLFYNKALTLPILQPVHNIYLLLLAEGGIVVFIVSLCFIGATIIRSMGKKRRPSSLAYTFSLVAILVLGFFDHYFLTIHQTQLLFAIIVGRLWQKP